MIAILFFCSMFRNANYRKKTILSHSREFFLSRVGIILYKINAELPKITPGSPWSLRRLALRNVHWTQL
jgi:hypothetical protein